MLSKNWKIYKQFIDTRGVLGVIDDRDIPFKIKRVFWIVNVPEGQTRGHHSHRECEQVVICLAGSFDVQLDEMYDHLKSTDNRGLYIPTGTRVILSNFSSDAICLVLCSEYYDESEVQND
jgi:dTDP-4-dehydrorhamnose 3,5-epimerase-like enzyme